METKPNVKDVLTGFFMQEPYTLATARDFKITIEDAAEMRAAELQDTEEGLQLYNDLIEIFKNAIDKNQHKSPQLIITNGLKYLVDKCDRQINKKTLKYKVKQWLKNLADML